jgi:hypothetical protein
VQTPLQVFSVPSWDKVHDRIGLRTLNNNPGALTTIGFGAACEDARHHSKEVTLLDVLACKA